MAISRGASNGSRPAGPFGSARGSGITAKAVGFSIPEKLPTTTDEVIQWPTAANQAATITDLALTI
jgi:hypothetical protein